jgi:hypothetical protein
MAMKRRILMVSAMILMLGSQVQMYAQKKGGPDHKRPGIEMHEGKRPGGPMKAISQGDIARLQYFYWKKYRVKISKKEAERILLADMRDRGPRDFAHNPPPPPKGKKPVPPKGPQRPPRR